MDEQIVIVGMGEVGRRLAQGADAMKLAYWPVTREAGQQWLSEPRGVPLLVCVRENDLPAVLAHVPPERGGDLIFVQNGFVDELIAPYPEATRAVIWFTVKGSFFADLLPSPVFGPRADLVRRLISAAGASAEALADQDVFRRYALEKAVWSCVVGAPLAVWGVDLATARHERMADVKAIVDEACDVVRVALGTEIAPQRVMATLDDTSTQLGWMRGGTKAVAWRNGRLVEWGERCGIPTPANRAVVEAVARQQNRTTELE
jgi:ketopantoate reductase